MKFFPLLTALAVMATLYLMVFERDRVIAFAAGEPASATSEPSAPAEPAPQPQRMAVVAQHSKAREVENAVLLRGRTEATRRVDIRSETSGLVISEPLRRGAFVSAGETLCELSPGTRQASLNEAEARLAEAEINYRAADRLSQEGFAAETRLISARAALQSAQAGVEAAQQEMARLTMKAPFDGLMEADAAELGSLLQPGGLCATVIQLDPIRLIGFAPETQVDLIETGAPAGARLASGREVIGRVTSLARSADPATLTFRVEVTVPNADLAIRDGQSAEIVISATNTTGHLLPASALTLDDDGRLGVRIVDATDHVRFQPVSLIRDTREGIWLSGLPEEANVIVVGQEYVREGVPVRVSYRDADTDAPSGGIELEDLPGVDPEMLQ